MKLKLLSLAVAAMTLSGCAAVQQAQGLYNTAKAGMTLMSVKKMVGDVKNAQPVFKGYDSVVLMAALNPREGDRGEVQQAFVGNMAYLIEENSRAADLPLQICYHRAACSGRTLVVQFTEEGFNRNLAEKITLGSALRGTLTYINGQDNTVLANTRIEPIKTYDDVMNMIHASFWTSMYVSKDRQVAADYMERVEAIEPVPAQFAGRLGHS